MNEKQLEEQYDALLTEGIISAAIVFILAKKLVTPIRKWKAFKMGLIDEKGNVIRKPDLPSERKALTILDRLILKIKKLIGRGKLALLTPLVLLASSKEETGKVITEREDDFIKNNIQFNKIQKNIETIIEDSGVSEDEYYSWFLHNKIIK